MAINWDELERNIDRAIDDAAGETDDTLASRASSLTRLTDEEIKGLFPAPADVKRLSELMKIVKSAEEENQKINRLIQNIENLGGTAIKLLDKFV